MTMLGLFWGVVFPAATFSEVNKAMGDTGICERLGEKVGESNSIPILCFLTTLQGVPGIKKVVEIQVSSAYIRREQDFCSAILHYCFTSSPCTFGFLFTLQI